MKSIGVFIIALAFLFSCSDQPYQQLDGISFKRGNTPCEDDKRHWLMDMVASKEADSIYLNTMDLNRKIEVHVGQLDTSSTLVKLLSATCEGDSLQVRLTAEKFYSSLNGSVPPHLKSTDGIQVKINMRDKLSDLEHISYKKAFESTMIQRYLDQNRWNTSLDTASQIHYELLKVKPSGKVNYDKAEVKYRMLSLSDKIISFSKEEEPLIYKKTDKALLKGIHFLVSRLKVGESIRAIVPSDMAFGEEGNTKVPGYMPIIIELEVLRAVD